jgi:starvation-inducible DNA-binding protein
MARYPREVNVDFKVYTNALKAYEAPSGDLYVTGTTSSTIRDLHGDEMTLNAIKTMADTAKQNMTIFLNHNYNVPQDLFGSVKDARVVKRFDAETSSEVYDLDIDVLVCKEDENPEAMRAFKAIKRGVKLGLSIGARVERVSKKKDARTGEDTYVIDSVKLMEASVVGIPANQRSYLQNALKSLKAAEKSGEIEIEKAGSKLSKGDFVSWSSSGGAARGQITRIVTDGQIDVPDSDFTITGTPDDPAALIRLWRKSGDSWAATDRLVGHKLSTLSKIDSLKSIIEIDTKAVEIEGQQGADKAPLVGALYTLLSETTAFYLKAHGAHWNVVGENFSQYHELFEEIYEDVHASLDPIAESLRKLNSPAPAEIKDLAGMVNSAPRAEDYEAESLAADLYAANEKLLENIMVAFKVASDANQQGIANFLAERQDMHQKWSWQLRASLAPEESEPESAETPEAPEAGDTEGDTIVDTEKATRVTVTVTQSDDKEKVKPAEENQAMEAEGAEAEAAVAKSDTEPVAEPVVEEPAVEPAADEPAAEEPAAEEPAAEEVVDPSVQALQDLGAVLVRASADERARIISKVAELAADGEPEAVAEAAEPTPEVTPEVAEEPAVAPVEPEAEVAVEAPAVEAPAVDEVTAIAKSALDAAFAAQQEVAVVKAQLTELLSQKATVEAELAKALDVVGRLMDLPSGRKSYSVATNNSKTNAPWLSPIIQRMLDSEE